MVDARGGRLTPSHAIKKSRRYRYYVSAALITGTVKEEHGWRLPAHQIEQAVLDVLTDALSEAGFVERFGLAGIPGDQLRKLLIRADPFWANTFTALKIGCFCRGSAPIRPKPRKRKPLSAIASYDWMC